MKPIEGFTNLFITRDGKIISTRSGKKKTLKTWLSAKGYECIIVTEKGIRHHLSIHREVAKAYIPNPDNKPEVNHLDGIKSRNLDTNLEWATPKENKGHMYDILGHSPVRNKQSCILVTPEDGDIECESVSAAARLAESRYGLSFSYMRRYMKTKTGFEIRRCND